MTTVTYNVPAATPPHTAVYLTPVLNSPGEVDVRLDSATATPVSPGPFAGHTTGLDLIIAPSGVSNFLFFDRVPAAFKPFTAGGSSGGIQVQADSGSNATLRMETKETNNDDRLFSITSSTTSDTIVRTTDVAFNEGDAHIGTGVTNLVIRTNDFDSPSGYWPPSSPSNFDPGSSVSVSTLAEGIHLTVDTGDGTYDKVSLGNGAGFVWEQAIVITGAGHDIVTVGGSEAGVFPALVDFGDGTGSGNNQLNVNEFGIVTLAQEPDSASHIVVVEDVNVGGDGESKIATLIVADPSTIDDLQVNNYGEAFVLDSADGTTIPTFGVGAVVGPLHSYASIAGESTIGTFTIEGEVDFSATSAPSTVTQFQVLATAVTGSTGIVNINSGADVTVFSSSRIGSLWNFFGSGGKLTLEEHGESDSNLLTVHTLYMGSTPSAPDGILDLNDNAMVVDHDGTSPVSDIQAMITAAYDTGVGSGHWGESGITSSLADDSTYAVGYADRSELSSTPAVFSTADMTSVLVRFTLYGDADLDGTVNLLDFNRLSANFNGTNKVWSQGDFNYDTQVNLLDFNKLAANFNDSLDGGGEGRGMAEGGGGDPDYSYEELLAMLWEQTGGW